MFRMVDETLKKRTCRCCNREFAYPVLKSKATRFHCEDCAQVKPDVRKVFELMNRRMKRMEAALAKAKQ